MKYYKNYKFRIYPSKVQDKEMRRHLWISKELWNKLLEATVKRYGKDKKFPSKSELQIMAKNSGLYAQTACVLSHRICRALRAKVKARKEGRKYGFPRFKSIDRMKSLNYPNSTQGFWLNKKLKVTPFGEITIKKHREIDGKIKTLTLKIEPTGKWYSIFAVEETKKQPRINTGGKIGIDLGLKTFATLSNGEKITNPRHFRKVEAQLAIAQRKQAGKIKGSANSITKPKDIVEKEG